MNFLPLFAKPNFIAAHRSDRSLKPENILYKVLQIGLCGWLGYDEPSNLVSEVISAEL